MPRQGVESRKRPVTILAFKRLFTSVEQTVSFGVVGSSKACQEASGREQEMRSARATQKIWHLLHALFSHPGNEHLNGRSSL